VAEVRGGSQPITFVAGQAIQVRVNISSTITGCYAISSNKAKRYLKRQCSTNDELTKSRRHLESTVLFPVGPARSAETTLHLHRAPSKPLTRQSSCTTNQPPLLNSTHTANNRLHLSAAKRL